MPEKITPSNTVHEIMLMCEGASLTDLVIIMDQVDKEKRLYKPKELKNILKFIAGRRTEIESSRKWEELKQKLGL